MAEGQRSPFGHLVFMHRRRLNLAQLDVAREVSKPSNASLGAATVAERTVAALESRADPSKWVSPRPSTVSALLKVFGIEPGTADYDEFVTAARFRHDRQGPATIPAPPDLRMRGPVRPSPPIADGFLAAGREPHLARLDQAIDDAIAGLPGVVFVSAGPGTGKTSLIEHAARQAVDRHDHVVVLWGDCTGRSGAADPHQPFRQILGTLAGDASAAGPHQLVSSANEDRIASRTPAGIAALLDVGEGLIDRFIGADILRALIESDALDAATSTRLAAVLDTSPGAHANALGHHEQYFRLLSRYAASGPAILVLEDLHWADIGTTSLLFHLIWRLHDQQVPLLILGSFRPTDLEPVRPGDRHPFPTVLRESTRFFDNPVLDLSNAVGGDAGRSFVDAMVTHLVADAPAAFRDTLFEKTAGLPLFVRGMIRWRQSPAIVGEHGQFHWTPDPANLPSEIDALFAAQVDRLPPDLHALLNAACVQGGTFSAEVVMQMRGLARQTTIEMIDAQLTRRFQVLAPGEATTIAGQRSHTYRFAHALLRDYVHHQLTDLERAHYHAATAEAMLALYGAGHHNGASGIAYHFDQAGDRQRAASAYLDAGIHAMNHQDYGQARFQFERIGELDLRDEAPTIVAQALVGLGNCAYGDGDSANAATLFERAYDLAERENLPLVMANCLTSMGRLDFDAGRMRDGANRLSQAIDLLIAQGDRPEACRTLALLSHTLHGIGRYDEAAATARQAIAMGTDLHDDMFVVSGMTALGNCAIAIGHYAEAIAMYEKGIAICEEHGHLHRATLCWYNISLCEFEREEWDRSSAALEIIFDPKRRATSRLIGMAEFNAGIVAEGRGNLPEADRRYRTSHDIRVSNGQDALIVDSLAGLLRVATGNHDHDRIRSLIPDIEERVAERGFDGVEHYGRLFVTVVCARLELGEIEGARDHARKGVAFVSERANGLADPDHRASYLTTVSAHRRLFELAAELGVAAG